jgi:hypothetical protein
MVKDCPRLKQGKTCKTAAGTGHAHRGNFCVIRLEGGTRISKADWHKGGCIASTGILLLPGCGWLR